MVNVFVTGSFDVIHRGHVEFLKYAKKQGTRLSVAIDTDERIREKKGDTRPYHTLEDRVAVINSIKYVDDIFCFGSDSELIDLIKLISPNIIVVGSDWQGKEIVGGDLVDTIVYFPRIEGHSTTEILGEA